MLQSLSEQARVAVIDLNTRAVVGYLSAGETPDGVVYTRRVVSRSRLESLGESAVRS